MPRVEEEKLGRILGAGGFWIDRLSRTLCCNWAQQAKDKA